LIGKNPSLHGGTWAWCFVQDDRIINCDYGLLDGAAYNRWCNSSGHAVTNNFMELYAAVHALEYYTDKDQKFDGTIFTDSKITLHRITDSASFKGIPKWLKDRALKVRFQRHYQAELVVGHPTIAEQKQGFRARNGLPVSKWNIWCDEQCQRQAQEFLQRLAEKTPGG
jgi:ribonuclease HI